MQGTELPFLSSWQNFTIIIGAAAATLTGLMFVVITLMSRIEGQVSTMNAALSAFNTPTVTHFCAVLLLAGILSAPWPAFSSSRDSARAGGPWRGDLHDHRNPAYAACAACVWLSTAVERLAVVRHHPSPGVHHPHWRGDCAPRGPGARPVCHRGGDDGAAVYRYPQRVGSRDLSGRRPFPSGK